MAIVVILRQLIKFYKYEPLAQAAGLSTCARPRPALLTEYEVEASGVLCGAKLVTSMPVVQGLISPILSVPLLTAL